MDNTKATMKAAACLNSKGYATSGKFQLHLHLAILSPDATLHPVCTASQSPQIFDSPLKICSQFKFAGTIRQALILQTGGAPGSIELDLYTPSYPGGRIFVSVFGPEGIHENANRRLLAPQEPPPRAERLRAPDPLTEPGWLLHVGFCHRLHAHGILHKVSFYTRAFATGCMPTHFSAPLSGSGARRRCALGRGS